MLKFYDIDKDYILYLKQFEKKIPNIDYQKHDKFICGVVLNINDINYYAPISSSREKKRTSMLIYNEKNEPVSSIRFSFMFPVSEVLLKEKDFNSEDYLYKRLLMEELDYCNQNREKIYKLAEDVYKIGVNKNHPLSKVCCDFKLLEEKYMQYLD